MASNKAFAAGGLLLSIAACVPGPVEGGPCTYDEIDFEAVPAGYTDRAVLFKNPEGETFDIQNEAFAILPGEDDAVTVRWMRIVEGTCTPEMYAVVEKEEDAD